MEEGYGKKKASRRVPGKEAMLVRMADLCARSEQCAFDIRRKIIAKGLSASDCDDILAELERRGFIDERRFAGSFARDKVKFSGWGRLKIRMSLVARRISRDAIEEALSDIDPKEYSAALIRAARGKARGLDLAIRDDRAKLFRHLVARGFEPALITRLINKITG